MNEYFNDAYEAFKNVNSRYYFTEVFRNMDSYFLTQESSIQSTENSFSAELFRNWRNIMELDNRWEAYQNLALDFDLRKEWFDDKIISRTKSYRPDLVLHRSQVEWSPEFQKIYIEVKTNPNPSIKDDIQKLANAIYRLRFENAIFISVNSNYDELVSHIHDFVSYENKRLLRLDINIEWERIHLFHSKINDQNKIIKAPISFAQIIR